MSKDEALIENIYAAICAYLHPMVDHRAVRAEIAAGVALSRPSGADAKAVEAALDLPAAPLNEEEKP